MYRVSGFAEKAGVTVRTLHHYDRLGLLKPSGRTEAGYRLYGERDFARLQHIVTLKFIGLPLKQIKDLLDRGDLDLKSTLSLQRRLLLEKRLQVEAAIQAIEEAERSLQSGSAPDLAALKTIIEVMERQNNMEWAKKYYTEEAQTRIAERARNWTPELQAKVEQDWKTLIGEVEAAIAANVDPSDGRAQSLAQRWSELVRGFTGGDAGIQQGLNKLYADQGNWPSSLTKPFSDEVWQYVRKAMAAHKISCA
jgi:MerR family transcriptional regulator, thiopeptide resistance regulator